MAIFGVDRKDEIGEIAHQVAAMQQTIDGAVKAINRNRCSAPTLAAAA